MIQRPAAVTDEAPALTPEQVEAAKALAEKRILEYPGDFRAKSMWTSVIRLANALKAAWQERDRARAALRGLQHGDCWCQMAIGNPMVKRHSSACVAAAEALRDTP